MQLADDERTLHIFHALPAFQRVAADARGWPSARRRLYFIRILRSSADDDTTMPRTPSFPRRRARFCQIRYFIASMISCQVSYQ